MPQSLSWPLPSRLQLTHQFALAGPTDRPSRLQPRLTASRDGILKLELSAIRPQWHLHDLFLEDGYHRPPARITGGDRNQIVHATHDARNYIRSAMGK